MSFKSEKVVPEYENLIGWRQHHDTSEIEIEEALTRTQTGEYYQQKHPAMVLDNIQALIPENYDINKYLKDVVTDSTNEIFNDLIQYRQIKDFGKTLLDQATLLNKYGSARDTIVNQNRFVGFQIRPKAMTGLTAVINAIGLQFDKETTFTVYLYHSSVKEPLKEIEVTTAGSGWKWTITSEELSAFDSNKYH